jgi:hypothetical protein
MDRRRLIGILAGFGSIGISAACGSPTAASLSRPVPACSLVSKTQAAATLALAGGCRPQQQVPTNQQSYCVYPGSTDGNYLIVNVAWSPAELSTFEKAHDGHQPTAVGTLPSGQSVPAPRFVKVGVDGYTAYWSARQPLPISGTTNYPSLLVATRDGYVASLSAIGLTESQNEQVLSTMLRKL